MRGYKQHETERERHGEGNVILENKKDARSSHQTDIPSTSSALVVLAVQSFLVGDFCNICHQTLGTLICMF